MKIAINLLLGVCIVLLITSCEDETAAVPQAAMAVNKNQLIINESMIINFTGVADQVVVYTGDDMHNYELRDQSNTGFVVNKNLFTYSYTSPGTYKVVCVASTYTDGAIDLKRDTCSYTVTVIDDRTEIDKISCPQIIYDEVFAEKRSNDEWLMRLPRKIKYNNRISTISLSQRLRFYTQSGLTQILINGKEFSSTAKYDLSAPIEVSVKSDYGTTRLHKLYTINYPEFQNFTLAGTTGTLIRNEFDYSTFVLEIILPEGTDVSNLIPEFTTCSPGEKVYIEEVEQTSGTSAADFTKNINYRLVSTLAEHPEMQAVANVSVKITYQ